MASEIRVDKINSLSGVGTVTLSPTGVDIAGITTAATLKATTGIVTTLTATTGIVTTLTANTARATTGIVTTLTANTARATTGIVTTLTATTGIVTTLTTNTLTANTTAKVGSGVTLSPDGDVFATGVTTCLGTSVLGNAIVGAAVTITSDGIDASGIGITCANINGNAIGGFKNLIMNGDFALDQRYGNAEQNPAVNGSYYADRWKVDKSAASKFQIHTTNEHLPGNQGYPYALKCNVTNAFDPSGTNGSYFLIEQPIEGRNVLGLKLGSSECQPITVQFWVRSSVTGTYSVALRNSAYNRHIVNEYTINSANTYEKKVITFANVATGGTWLSNAGVGLRLDFSLGAGSDFRTSSLNVLGTTSAFASSNDVNWINNANATFFLTGVQLEAGTEATEFERISHGEKLRMCQRYYQNINPRWTGWIVSATQIRAGIVFPTTMRATPSCTHSSSYIQYGPGGQQSGSLQSFSDISDSGCVAILNNSGGMTTNAGSTGAISMAAQAEL